MVEATSSILLEGREVVETPSILLEGGKVTTPPEQEVEVTPSILLEGGGVATPPEQEESASTPLEGDSPVSPQLHVEENVTEPVRECIQPEGSSDQRKTIHLEDNGQRIMKTGNEMLQ